MWSIGKKSLWKIWRRKCTVFTSTGANPYAAYKPFSRIKDCKTSDGGKEYSESLKEIDEINQWSNNLKEYNVNGRY